MKTIIISLLALFFFSSFAFSQYVEKKKEEKKETIQETVKDTCSNKKETKDYSNYSPYKEKTKTDWSLKKNTGLSQYDKTDNNEPTPKRSDYYKETQYQLIVSFIRESRQVSFDAPGLDIKGVYIDGKATQDQTLEKNKSYKAYWGVEGEYGKFTTTGKIRLRGVTTPDQEFNITSTLVSLGVAYAVARDNSGFQRFTFGVKAAREIENGTSGLYQWRQIDYMVRFGFWSDVSKNKNPWFSLTNIFAWYNYVVNSESSALFDGKEVERPVWDKTTFGAGIEHTLLKFDLGSVALHFGFGLMYEHFNQNMQDLYTPLGFLELHGRGGYKIASVEAGKRLSSINPDVNRLSARVSSLKFNLDLFQVVYNVFHH